MVNEPSPIKKEFYFDYRSKNQQNLNFSRYKNLRRLVNEDGYSYLETPFMIEIPESNKDSFYSVEAGYENRLDLISFRFYNTPFLWWVLAKVNHLDNPMIVPCGIVLRIPDFSSLQGEVI